MAQMFSIYFRWICAGQRKALQRHRRMNKFIHAAHFLFIIGAWYAEAWSLGDFVSSLCSLNLTQTSLRFKKIPHTVSIGLHSHCWDLEQRSWFKQIKKTHTHKRKAKTFLKDSNWSCSHCFWNHWAHHPSACSGVGLNILKPLFWFNIFDLEREKGKRK